MPLFNFLPFHLLQVRLRVGQGVLGGEEAGVQDGARAGVLG
jgi:hypothetical protein